MRKTTVVSKNAILGTINPGLPYTMDDHLLLCKFKIVAQPCQLKQIAQQQLPINVNIKFTGKDDIGLLFLYSSTSIDLD